MFIVLEVCVCVSAHAPPAAQIHLLYSLPNPLAPESGIGFSCLVSGAMLRTVWHGVSMWSHPEGQGYLTLKVRKEQMDMGVFGQIGVRLTKNLIFANLTNVRFANLTKGAHIRLLFSDGQEIERGYRVP